MRKSVVTALMCGALIFSSAWVAHAYYPVQCHREHAEDDYAKAELIVIARVIKVEQRVETIEQLKMDSYSYFATLKIGRVIKGDLKKVGDTFEMFEGGFLQKGEDNAEPTYVATCNTHSRMGLIPGNAFLLFLKPLGDVDGNGALKTFVPLSCHFSIHELVTLVDEKTNVRSTGVKEGSFRPSDRATIPLDKFLAEREAASRKK